MSESTKPSSAYARDAAAYGGGAWHARATSHADEIGSLWGDCGLDSEWRKLETVLLHCPGDELNRAKKNVDEALFIEPVDLVKAREEHHALTELYRSEGVEVLSVDPVDTISPNQMFCADLFAMTPQGAVLARPAARVRAGEEVQVARALARSGIPILKTLTGDAVFEGADLMWLDELTAMVGRGHRTNQVAIDQLAGLLEEIGCQLTAVDLPFGTMHFMGMLRIPAQDLAICWHRRTPHATVEALRARGFRVEFIPEGRDAKDIYRAMNFVTLQSGRVLMVDGIASARAYFESLGIECLTSPTAELSKAAGNIGCLTGVVKRQRSKS